jgi:signal transduction histidine kinase/ligand-binding sensor protein
MTIDKHHQQYIDFFKKHIIDLEAFLIGVFTSLFKEWKGGFIIVSVDEDYILLEDLGNYSPFCDFIRNIKNKNEICKQCDKNIAIKIAKNKKAEHYWCVWGMRDLAVPIVIHNVCVGVIFCGQKRIENSEFDKEGKNKLISFVKDHHPDLLNDLNDLIKKRNESPAVPIEDFNRFKRDLEATSKFISQMLYSRMEENVAESYELDESKKDLEKKKALYLELSRIDSESNIDRFWNDYTNILKKINDLFDCKGSIVLLSEINSDDTNSPNPDRIAEVVSQYNIPISIGENYKVKEIITYNLNIESEPIHSLASDITNSAKLSKKIIDQNNRINLVLYDKSLINMHELHFLVFFDTVTPRKNSLYLHQKKVILSQLVNLTINTYNHLERRKDFDDNLKKKNRFLLDITHTFRQPLQGILSYCENLLIPGIYDDERKKKILKYLQQLTKHLNFLTQSSEYAVREVENPNIFSLELNYINTNLNKILIEASINMQGYSEASGIRIHVNEDNLNEFEDIKIDNNKFDIAMHSVLYNAIKYSYPDTTITIYVKKDNDEIQIFIENYGIEIPKDQYNVIFDRRIRLRNAELHAVSGLGVGLFVARGFMEAMNGKAFVVDSLATAKYYVDNLRIYHLVYKTTFCFSLPI